jgi:vancomycin resistance protein YoaR
VRRSILHLNKKVAKKVVLFCFLIATLIFGAFVIYYFFYIGKIYPNINIAGAKIGGLSVSGATNLLSSNIDIPTKIQLTGAEQIFDIDTKDIDFSYDYSESAQRAFSLTRTGNFFYDFSERILILFRPKNIGISVNFDVDKLDKVISVISGQISENPIEPTITLNNGFVFIDKGRAGTKIDTNSLKILIGESLSLAKKESVEIPIIIIDNTLTQIEADELKKRAEQFIKKSLELKFEYTTYNLNDKDLIELIDIKSGLNNQKLDALFLNYSDKVNRDPQNPKFVFDNGRVTEFQPALDGVRIIEEDFKNEIITSLGKIEGGTDKVISFEIPVLRAPPEITTDKINNLGINEILGRGSSTYFNSISSRVHNVVLATSRINGTLVKPGDTFSFNDTLGDVSQFTGYKQAYIISDGKTILGDGGGVCQVSTTLFRSVLKAGLPIVERQAHAYRVGYYEQGSPPGLDATVYGPSPDFKFINNTPAHILIQATADPKNYSLVFELYGTSDGRVSVISKPIVTNVTTPAGDLYQDDSTLSVGTVKQIEYKAWGAKVVFNYTVARNGEEIFKKTFISNYRPWQAVYLRGTAPAN